jgi:broad specificity phosphatase PhoE
MMKKTVQVVVVRHPEKDGDCITPYGAQQAFASAQQLNDLGVIIDRAYSSGFHRTWQAAMVMSSVINWRDSVTEISVNPKFSYVAPLKGSYQDDSEGFLNEMGKLRKNGCTTIEAARNAGSERFKEYIRLASKNLQEGLFEVARELIANGKLTALVLCHSPYTELCSDPAETPLGLGESDAVIYEVEVEFEEIMGEISKFGNAAIVSSKLIPAPLPGKTN